MGQCVRIEGCVCGGDTVRVREGCAFWDKARDPSGWQPIETAPMDGTIVLLAHAGRTLAGYYAMAQDAMKIEADRRHPWEILDHTNGTNAVANPTHWQPMPAPPA